MLGTHRTSSPLLARHGLADRRSAHHRTRRGWRVEQLEGRTLLSILSVTSTYDSGDNANPGDNTLRWAIEKANDNNGDDTIDIQVTGTITLKSALPDLNDTTGVTEINGPGAASLTVARSTDPGTPEFRIFTVDAGTSVLPVGPECHRWIRLPRRRHLQCWEPDDRFLHHHRATTQALMAAASTALPAARSSSATPRSPTTPQPCPVTAEVEAASGAPARSRSWIARSPATPVRGVAASATTIEPPTGSRSLIARSPITTAETEEASALGGPTTVLNCTFAHNSAYNGGAIQVVGPDGALTLVNSTLSGNSAQEYRGRWHRHLAEHRRRRCRLTTPPSPVTRGRTGEGSETGAPSDPS